MILEMLRWWYATGWLQAAKRIIQWPTRVEHAFSLSLLLTTLFSPWRRIITVGGRSFDAKIKASLDNLVSRCIGFFIRIVVILTAGFTMLFAFLAGTFLAIVWPLLPPLVLFCIYKGIAG